MKALWERFGGLARVARQWRGRRCIGVVCAAALSATGCKSGIASRCLTSDAPADCDAAIDAPEGTDDLPQGAQDCDLSAVAGSATGICVPHVDAGWHTLLARMTYVPKSQLGCIDSAPYPGLRGVEVRDDGLAPRNVIGCSVDAFPSCDIEGQACVPFAPEYPACITQSGDPPPPCLYGPYTEKTTVEEDDSDRLVTLCCRPPDEPG